jgi:hypothetical protein
MKKQIIATYQKIKLLEIIDLKRKKIIIINNLDNHKINNQTIKIN